MHTQKERIYANVLKNVTDVHVQKHKRKNKRIETHTDIHYIK